MNVFTEKNKFAPSQYSVPIVFDKKYGAVAVLSEYVFMRDITKVERKYWKVATKLIYPLCISTSANSKVLTVIDPTTKNVLYKSDKFRERNLIIKMQEDQTFAHWFNRAVEISVDQRIKVALFRNDPGKDERAAEIIAGENTTSSTEAPAFVEEPPTLASQFDPDLNPVNPIDDAVSVLTNFADPVDNQPEEQITPVFVQEAISAQPDEQIADSTSIDAGVFPQNQETETPETPETAKEYVPESMTKTVVGRVQH